MSIVNLDLDEPVQLLVDHLNDNFSAVPVTVISKNGIDYQKGGYQWTKPPIIPVYGEEGKIRKGQTDLRRIPGQAQVTVYMVSGMFTETDKREEFATIEKRLTIDIFHAHSKFRCWKLYNELKRCVSQSKTTPNGNYHYFVFLEERDLSDRRAGLFRIAFDVYLVKVDDYIG